MNSPTAARRLGPNLPNSFAPRVGTPRAAESCARGPIRLAQIFDFNMQGEARDHRTDRPDGPPTAIGGANGICPKNLAWGSPSESEMAPRSTGVPSAA